MTTPTERIRAITQAERFLLDLAHGKYPRTPKAVKDEARARLRHYPTAGEVGEMVRPQRIAMKPAPDDEVTRQGIEWLNGL